MSPEDRADRVVDEAVLWVPAIKGDSTLETRKARRRFDYHLAKLSKELGWNELDGMRAHLTAVRVAEKRLAGSTDGGEGR